MINSNIFLSILLSLLNDRSKIFTLLLMLFKIYFAPLSVILLFDKMHFYINLAYLRPAPSAVAYLSPRW